MGGAWGDTASGWTDGWTSDCHGARQLRAGVIEVVAAESEGGNIGAGSGDTRIRGSGKGGGQGYFYFTIHSVCASSWGSREDRELERTPVVCVFRTRGK